MQVQSQNVPYSDKKVRAFSSSALNVFLSSDASKVLINRLYILLAGLFTVKLLFTKPQFTVPGLVIVGLGFPLCFWAKERRGWVNIAKIGGWCLKRFL